MSLLEWKDQYSLGDETLDHEHKVLIDLINAVHEQITAPGDGNDPTRVLGGLGEISASVSAHFALEERQMQAQGYRDLIPHKKDHEKLLDEISDVMEAVEGGLFEDFGERLSKVLKDWFSVHFQTFDREYHNHIPHSDNG